jgi:hypothetical protein
VESGSDLVGTSSFNGVALSTSSLEETGTLGSVTCEKQTGCKLTSVKEEEACLPFSKPIVIIEVKLSAEKVEEECGKHKKWR